jgi:glutaminase
MELYIDLEQKLNDFLAENIDDIKKNVPGKCASYIPELEKANPNDLGFSLILPSGKLFLTGDYDTPFTIQSIAKVVTFMAACMYRGTGEVLQWVDVEPTGTAFNSTLSFELSTNRKPYNPMINSGAITVASLIPGFAPEDKVNHVLDIMSKLLDREVFIDHRVFQSEWETAYRNRAIANLLKENGLLDSSEEDALAAYISISSAEITVEDLARLGLILSYDGYDPFREEQLIPETIAQLAKVVMFTCGMYDASGKFAAFVGIPAKSGVSGGILGAIPPSSRNHPLLKDGGGIGIYGPAINEQGNSVKGMRLLESFLQKYRVQIF